MFVRSFFARLVGRLFVCLDDSVFACRVVKLCVCFTCVLFAGVFVHSFFVCSVGSLFVWLAVFLFVGLSLKLLVNLTCVLFARLFVHSFVCLGVLFVCLYDCICVCWVVC